MTLAHPTYICGECEYCGAARGKAHTKDCTVLATLDADPLLQRLRSKLADASFLRSRARTSHHYAFWAAKEQYLEREIEVREAMLKTGGSK